MKTLTMLLMFATSIFGSCEKEFNTPDPITVTTQELTGGFEDAYFASGCFWCVEGALEQIRGVSDVVSGYAGGTLANPTYNSHGDHTEAVRVIYHPNVVSYQQLLDAFEDINNFETVGQHPDFGESYRSAIFPKSGDQQTRVNALLSKYPGHTVQEGTYANVNFTPAEDYHQNYFRRFIRGESVVNSSYGAAYTAPRIAEFREDTDVPLYTREQFTILFNKGTEVPHTDPNRGETRDGVYVSIVTGEVLFHSEYRFVSDSGWLSFSAVKDESLFDLPPDAGAIEIREKSSNTHLGHIIQDSPDKAPNGRWCMNGKVLEFIPNK